jgi:hypothetical protein
MSYLMLPTEALKRDENDRQSIASTASGGDRALSLALLGFVLLIALGAVIGP